MNLNLKTFLQIGEKIGTTLFPQIAAVDALARTIGSLHGPQKAEAVIQTSIESILATEEILGKDFVDDAKFRRGLQMINDGAVLVKQAIEERQAPPS